MITSPNLYAGKSRNEVIAPAVYGGDTVKAGLWKVVPTMLSEYVYTTLNFGDTLTAGNFCGAGANTASTLSEIQIVLTRFKADHLICKDNFRGTYLEDNPMPAIDAYIETAIRSYTKVLENLRWSGDTALLIPELAIQNGVVRQLVVGGNFIPVAGASTANITSPTTVIAELNKALAVVPADVRYSADFKIIVAPEVFSAFRQAAWADGNFNAGLANIQSFATNQDPALGAVGYFYNIPMYIATGLDAVTTAPSTKANRGVALMGIFNQDNSNLILATDLMADQGRIEVLDLEPTTGSENWRFKFDFKQGIGVANQSQIVMYRQ
jgi:hypothetical protein